MTQAIPSGRAGTVDEAAGIIYLMFIAANDYITGQLLVVSGGWTC